MKLRTNEEILKDYKHTPDTVLIIELLLDIRYLLQNEKNTK